MRLNHVSLTVGDRERSARFYAEHFGLTARVFETATTVVVGGPGGARVALEQQPDDVPTPLPRGNHFGFELDGLDAVRAARVRLREAGVPELEWHDDGGFARVQVSDPDGYGVDLFAEEAPPA